jgi:hypothetical protein
MKASGRSFEMAGVVGDVFDQKAMVVMDAQPGPGLSPVGVVGVRVPKGSVDTLRDVQRELGDYASGGWTYHNGRVQLLNFSGKSNADYAKDIDRALGGRYNVDHATLYSAYIPRESYASPRSDSRGNAWRPRADSLKQEFARSLAGEVAAALKVQPGQADAIADAFRADYNPYHVRAGQHGGEFTSKAQVGGLLALTGEAEDALIAENLTKDLDQLRLEASANQQRLEALGKLVGEETGVEFHGPPPDAAIKTAESIMRKVRDEGYPGPGALKDISRAMFVVDSPEQSDTALRAMAAKGATIYDRGWKKQSESGYLGRYAFVKHPNGGVSEVQFVPRGLLALRNGEGHKLYEIMRVPSNPMPVREEAARKSRALYATGITEPFKRIY